MNYNTSYGGRGQGSRKKTGEAPLGAGGGVCGSYCSHWRMKVDEEPGVRGAGAEAAGYAPGRRKSMC